MLTPFIEVPYMIGGGCTDATPDDLPAQIVGPTQALDLGILKANNAAMPTAGNVQATAFAAALARYGEGAGLRAWRAGVEVFQLRQDRWRYRLRQRSPDRVFVLRKKTVWCRCESSRLCA